MKGIKKWIKVTVQNILVLPKMGKMGPIFLDPIP